MVVKRAYALVPSSFQYHAMKRMRKYISCVGMDGEPEGISQSALRCVVGVSGAEVVGHVLSVDFVVSCLEVPLDLAMRDEAAGVGICEEMGGSLVGFGAWSVLLTSISLSVGDAKPGAGIVSVVEAGIAGGTEVCSVLEEGTVTGSLGQFPLT